MLRNHSLTPYDMVQNKIDENEKPFSGVIGHKSQKDELTTVLNWFKNYEYWKSKKVSIPKGVLLYGEPGNGKSLIIKEAIKYISLPTFIFKGETIDVCDGLEKTFKKAKEVGHSVVIIDELDLLINKENRATRVLQENLDGVDSRDDIFVIAATNNLWEIPRALLRNGRLEKIINIPNPTGEEAVELLKKHFNDFGVSLPSDINEDELGLTMSSISCAGVKTIANDIVLRNGFENITTEMIIDSIYRITNHVQNKQKPQSYAVAVHEAGHAVMVKRFPEFFKLTRLDIKQEGGLVCAKEVEEDYWPYEKILADIKISMAGVIAQKIVCKTGSSGCETDLQHARKEAWDAINFSGFLTCSDTLPEIRPFSNVRAEPEKKKERNTRLADRLLRKCEKDVFRYLKKNISLIRKIADELFKRKFLSSSDITAIMEYEMERTKYKFYETMWFFDHDNVREDWNTKTFRTKRGALKYYQKHKNDEGTYWWKVTKRTYGFEIVETYIDEFKEKI